MLPNHFVSWTEIFSQIKQNLVELTEIFIEFN